MADMDELKWYLILMGVFIVVMCGGLMYSEHLKQECRVEMVRMQLPADDIQKVCK
jgi:hypothetical protein